MLIMLLMRYNYVLETLELGNILNDKQTFVTFYPQIVFLRVELDKPVV